MSDPKYASLPPGFSELENLADREVDLDAMLLRIVDRTVKALHADRGTLYLVDHATSELVSRVAHLPEIAEIRLRLGEGVAGWVAETGKVLNVPHGTVDPRFAPRIDKVTGYQTTSLLATPIRAAAEGGERAGSPVGTTLGVLQVLNKQGGAAFDADDERRLADYAQRAANVLGKTSLRSQLRPGSRLPLAFRFNHIVGESPSMHEVYLRTARAARTTATVLVRGESGTGKELIAKAIHHNSGRTDAAFVKVDCGALPEQLIENELFGHERGAFTGADQKTDGKVAAAHGGTLFLDEIGELPLPVQAKLLRLLQERAYFRVGGNAPQAADVRFVCATHRDLEAEVAAGRFRQDLYYRLRVVEIFLPPLRDRGAPDLDRLVDHFLFECGKKHGLGEKHLTADARARLHAHRWPGNVRELEHVIESAVVMAPDDDVTAELLPIGPPATRTPSDAGRTATDPGEDGDFHTSIRALDDVERDYVAFVLRACGGNRSEAARRLGIGRNTLLRKIGE